MTDKRSQAAKRGWATRRTAQHLKDGLSPKTAKIYSNLSRAQITLLHDMRSAVLGPDANLTGRTPEGREALQDIIAARNNHKR
jgi:hypothetical protein